MNTIYTNIPLRVSPNVTVLQVKECWATAKKQSRRISLDLIDRLDSICLKGLKILPPSDMSQDCGYKIC